MLGANIITNNTTDH